MTTWSKEPPKEPGWYWVRLCDPVFTCQPEPLEWSPGDWLTHNEEWREFWPIPISPPQEGAQEE